MPDYDVTDSVTGVTLRLTGDTPPTDEELAKVFDAYRGDQVESIAVNIPEANSLALDNTIKPDTKDPEARQLLDESEAERQQMIDLAKTRFPPEIVDSWQDNPIEFSETGEFLNWSQVLPGGGLVQGAESLNLAAISRK